MVCMRVQVGMERMSQTVSRAASLVTEALTWGFDISTWRAHLNEITWPEVLRQLALAAGWGPRRCRPARATRAYDERRLGEDIVEGTFVEHCGRTLWKVHLSIVLLLLHAFFSRLV